MKEKGSTPLLILMGILILVAVGTGAYYLGTIKDKPQNQNQITTPSATPSPTTPQLISTTPTASGTVTGKLCYPSEFLPKGEIIAKSLTSGETFTQDYPGSANGGGSTYSLQLKPGSYHLKYEVSANFAGYYTNYSLCVNDPNGANCSGQQTRPALPVSVSAGGTLQNINLCDFYYPPDNPPQF